MLALAICEDESWFAADLKKKAESFLIREGLDASIRIYTSGEELLEQHQYNNAGTESDFKYSV